MIIWTPMGQLAERVQRSGTLGLVELHRLGLVRAATARMGRYLGEPTDYQRQDGLENVVIGDSWQFLP